MTKLAEWWHWTGKEKKDEKLMRMLVTGSEKREGGISLTVRGTSHARRSRVRNEPLPPITTRHWHQIFLQLHVQPSPPASQKIPFFLQHLVSSQVESTPRSPSLTVDSRTTPTSDTDKQCRTLPIRSSSTPHVTRPPALSSTPHTSTFTPLPTAYTRQKYVADCSDILQAIFQQIRPSFPTLARKTKHIPLPPIPTIDTASKSRLKCSLQTIKSTTKLTPSNRKMNTNAADKDAFAPKSISTHTLTQVPSSPTYAIHSANCCTNPSLPSLKKQKQNKKKTLAHHRNSPPSKSRTPILSTSIFISSATGAQTSIQFPVTGCSSPIPSACNIVLPAAFLNRRFTCSIP